MNLSFSRLSLRCFFFEPLSYSSRFSTLFSFLFFSYEIRLPNPHHVSGTLFAFQMERKHFRMMNTFNYRQTIFPVVEERRKPYP